MRQTLKIAFGKFAKSGFKAELFGLEISPKSSLDLDRRKKEVHNGLPKTNFRRFRMDSLKNERIFRFP